MAFKRRGVFGFRAARHVINRERKSAECLTSLLSVPFPHTLVSSCHISCVAEGKTRWFPSRMWAKGKKAKPWAIRAGESRGINGDE